MTTKKSEFGKINKIDLLNALYHAVGTSIMPVLGYMSATGTLPVGKDLVIILSAFLSAFFASLFKGKYTNENGEFSLKNKK